jgi:hypothetical protein
VANGDEYQPKNQQAKQPRFWIIKYTMMCDIINIMESAKHNQIRSARILFALEIGGNSGHIGRAMALARAATRRGCATIQSMEVQLP